MPKPQEVVDKLQLLLDEAKKAVAQVDDDDRKKPIGELFLGLQPTRQRFKAKDRIYSHGDPAGVVYVLEYGKVAVYNTLQRKSGATYQKHVRTVHQGQIFGDLATKGELRHNTAEVLDDAVVLEYRVTDIKKAIAGNPVAESLARWLSMLLAPPSKEEVDDSNVRLKLARLFVDLAAEQGVYSGETEITGWTQKKIGRQFTAHRSYVNTVSHELDGLINMNGGRWWVNVDKLRRVLEKK